MTSTRRRGRRTAALYARVSRNDAVDGHGTDAQLRACRELAEREGLTVVAEYVDDDRSAFSSRRREAYEELLAGLDTVDVVLAWSPDRLYRRMRDLVALTDRLEAAGVTVRTVQGGLVDLSTAGGQLQAHMTGAVAEHEARLKSERNRLRHAEIAREGRPNGGGGRPYGFEVDKVTHSDDEVAVVREMAARVVAGESLCSLVRELNERGTPTVSGQPWRVPTLRTLLLSPRVAGMRQHRGRLHRACWQPILTVGERARLQAVCATARPSRGKPRRLLSGLAVCGKCGSPLRSRVRSGRGTIEYTCLSQPGAPGCGGLGIQGAPLERFVAEMAFSAIDAEALGEAVANGAGDEHEAELADLDARRDAYAGLAARGEIAPSDFALFMGALDEERARLTEAVAADVVVARRRIVESGDVLRQRWPSMTTDQRRAVLDAVIESVVVLGGRVPAERIGERIGDVVWRA